MLDHDLPLVWLVIAVCRHIHAKSLYWVTSQSHVTWFFYLDWVPALHDVDLRLRGPSWMSVVPRALNPAEVVRCWCRFFPNSFRVHMYQRDQHHTQ